ncbi:SLATT domain-containing protein [Pseudoxanthomonas sp. LjRoot125]|uniref:SLATT domain-containing protein n=1 Tax=Pseudoxanthomonas sp. LjRoot125 TaxID=3342258 RepID=UPI003E12593D
MSQNKSPRDLLLEQIASEGYNVGYSASLHFATLDIASKVPTMVTVTSFAVGILGLVYPQFADKLPSAILLIIGICMLYARDYESRLGEYERTAIQLNNLYKRLHDLAIDAKSSSGQSAQLDEFRQRLINIRTEASDLNVSPQIFGASWKAHHRFFWVIDSSWVREHRNPKFSWRDMAPLSAFVGLGVIASALLAGGIHLFINALCQ